MNYLFFLMTFFMAHSIVYSQSEVYAQSEKEYKWAIVGAGPAGISAVAKLLQNRVDSKDIIWFDPAFNVGRMGEYYQNIFSNTTVGDFLKVVESIEIFSKPPVAKALQYFKLCDPNHGCLLKYIVNFMSICSDYFRLLVDSDKMEIKNIKKEGKLWRLEGLGKSYCADKVILAIGSKPKKFDYLHEKEISLYDAIDKEKLKHLVNSDDVVAVIGNAHSAILTMRILSDLGIKKIINFYRSNIKYTNLYYAYNASEGLSEDLSNWVFDILAKNPPENLIQVFNSEKNRMLYKSEITKIVYALGFEPHRITINGKQDVLHFDDRTGIIEHNLYGIGIAFPEGFIDQNGIYQRKVEILHFIHYIKRVLPIWMNQ